MLLLRSLLRENIRYSNGLGFNNVNGALKELEIETHIPCDIEVLEARRAVPLQVAVPLLIFGKADREQKMYRAHHQVELVNWAIRNKSSLLQRGEIGIIDIED